MIYPIGCQDPWFYKPDVPLPACDNITKILGSYARGPDNQGWDGQFWDRPYMAERELAGIERNNIKCSPPCKQTYYEREITFTKKQE